MKAKKCGTAFTFIVLNLLEIGEVSYLAYENPGGDLFPLWVCLIILCFIADIVCEFFISRAVWKAFGFGELLSNVVLGLLPIGILGKDKMKSCVLREIDSCEEIEYVLLYINFAVILVHFIRLVCCCFCPQCCGEDDDNGGTF
ncbi:uncharacterized protein [Clytia hemisphaerica]|uniref:Uncharacterized protein n=1 Tax=Clytia hemisphaerica TaxID=252671 RepID=A0A7M5VDT4_9CNID|eukprot:TCONS_00040985-protein